jgi:hypothetical protein
MTWSLQSSFCIKVDASREDEVISVGGAVRYASSSQTPLTLLLRICIVARRWDWKCLRRDWREPSQWEIPRCWFIGERDQTYEGLGCLCGTLVPTWRPSHGAYPIIRFRWATQCMRLLFIIWGGSLWDPDDASETTHFYRTEFANLHKEFVLTLRQKYISYYWMGRKHPGEVGVMEMLVEGSYCECPMPSLLAACVSFFFWVNSSQDRGFITKENRGKRKERRNNEWKEKMTRIGSGNRGTVGKTAPLQLYPPQIRHDVT